MRKMPLLVFLFFEINLRVFLSHVGKSMSTVWFAIPWLSDLR